MTAPGEMLAAALRYAACAWPVFPCRPGAKVPAIPAAHPKGDPARDACRGECGRQGHGFHDATTDLAVIRAWWTRWPRANVAVATGAPGPDVLDVDVTPAGNGFASFNALKRAGLLTGALALVRTRSGGLHVGFLGTTQACGSLPRLHLDFRSAGGYVLVPPSYVSADKKGPGGRYEVLDHRPGTATLDWSAVVALLDPPRAQRHVRPAQPVRPGELPPSVIRALEAPVTDRSAAMHHLVCACARADLDKALIHEVVAGYPPAVDKYGPRLHAEVERSLRRIGASA